jgi:membrane peptidoglycan carboxypeptidase
MMSLGTLVAGLVTLVVGGMAVSGAMILGELGQGLPPVEQVEGLFDPASGGAPRSSLVLDRTGSVVLLEAAGPASAERRGLMLRAGSPDTAPLHLVQATLAIIDPSFWEDEGYPADWLWGVVDAAVRGQPVSPGGSIAQRLVRQALLPPEDARRPAWERALREAMLASAMIDAYPRERILEMYLNSAYYGNWAYGADAAALVYFAKHASDLTLAESAMLAAVPLAPDLNPIDAPQQAKARQATVLEAMVRQGLLTPEAAQRAVSQAVTVVASAMEPAVRAPEFTWRAWRTVEAAFGPEFIHRSGLRVITTLDYDLQLQADCLLRTQVRRLSGAGPGMLEAALDGSPCIAGGLLPPMRPGDVGFDHRATQAAAVVLDPRTGELLALVGVGQAYPAGGLSLAEQAHDAGPALYPFIYLAAFASGSAPATMVLDVPSVFTDTGQGLPYSPADDDGVLHGPVRMRSALANAYPVAAARAADRVGVEGVLRTARQMGLTTLAGEHVAMGLQELMEASRVSLLDLAVGHGVIANRGRMAGAPSPSASMETARPLDPAVVLRIEDDSGRLLYAYSPVEQAVTSAPLSFVMAHVLSDEAARWPSLGQPNPLEIGRPAGAASAVSLDGESAWALGFTPARVVGVWMGNAEPGPMVGLTTVNGPAPIWHALIRYATRDLVADTWETPIGVSEIEVCDPSGLLATPHCPRTVREVFVTGTEPVYSDTLYRPFRVNRETGKLATLFTPLDLIEERVYLIPPPGAEAWAAQAGWEQPPAEYDTLYQPVFHPDVHITSPQMFTPVRGVVELIGTARPQDFGYYRLQYGVGLNPASWIQIGADIRQPVEEGVLIEWDTSGLSGLYTVQLLVVEEGGRLTTSAVHVTVDNQAPTLQLVLPLANQVFRRSQEDVAVLQADVADDLGVLRVEFYVDNRKVGQVSGLPYSLRWPLGSTGLHTVFARAVDQAGNRAESEPLVIRVDP